MSLRRNWDSPNKSLASECDPPPRTGGGGAHSPAGEGLGSPNADDWRKSLALCLLCDFTYERISPPNNKTISIDIIMPEAACSLFIVQITLWSLIWRTLPIALEDTSYNCIYFFSFLGLIQEMKGIRLLLHIYMLCKFFTLQYLLINSSRNLSRVSMLIAVGGGGGGGVLTLHRAKKKTKLPIWGGGKIIFWRH
jgi:hypothetical protein